MKKLRFGLYEEGSFFVKLAKKLLGEKKKKGYLLEGILSP